MAKDRFDELAAEAVGWFDGWIMPLGQEASKKDIESVKFNIARVFRREFFYDDKLHGRNSK